MLYSSVVLKAPQSSKLLSLLILLSFVSLVIYYECDQSITLKFTLCATSCQSNQSSGWISIMLMLLSVDTTLTIHTKMHHLVSANAKHYNNNSRCFWLYIFHHCGTKIWLFIWIRGTQFMIHYTYLVLRFINQQICIPHQLGFIMWDIIS